MTNPKSYCFGFELVERKEMLYQGQPQVRLTLVPNENETSLKTGQLRLFLSYDKIEDIEFAIQTSLKAGTRFRLKLEPEY